MLRWKPAKEFSRPYKPNQCNLNKFKPCSTNLYSTRGRKEWRI